MKKTDGVKMTKKEFAKEHTKLLSTLRHPTKQGLKREIKEQSRETRKVLKKR